MGARRPVLGVGWLLAMALVAPTMPGAEQVTPPPPPGGPTSAQPPTPVPPGTVPTPPAQPPPAAAVEPDPVEPPAEPAAEVTPARPDTPTDDPPPAPREVPRAFAAAPGSVTVKDFSFGPSSVTVGVGESVTWRNSGPSEHTATATDGSFDTGLLSSGESGSATFEQAGTFSYLCTPHPFMKGTVRVVAQTPDDSASDGGSAAADPTAAGDAGTGATDGSAGLPSTGAEPLWLAISGLGLLLIGASGTRRTARR